MTVARDSFRLTFMSSSNTPVALTSPSHGTNAANGMEVRPSRLGLPIEPSNDPRVHTMVEAGKARIGELKERLAAL